MFMVLPVFTTACLLNSWSANLAVQVGILYGLGRAAHVKVHLDQGVEPVNHIRYISAIVDKCP